MQARMQGLEWNDIKMAKIVEKCRRCLANQQKSTDACGQTFAKSLPFSEDDNDATVRLLQAFEDYTVFGIQELGKCIM